MPYLTLFLDDAVHASAAQVPVVLAAAPVSTVITLSYTIAAVLYAGAFVLLLLTRDRTIRDLED